MRGNGLVLKIKTDRTPVTNIVLSIVKILKYQQKAFTNREGFFCNILIISNLKKYFILNL